MEYVADLVRLEQFEAAAIQVVKRGDRILDLGCGTGILGLLCLRAGAAQVYAIDASAMIEAARESLVRAGWGDQVVFIRGQSQQIDLPQRVDVVICDLVGAFGFDAGIVQLFEDARRRFLKSGGSVIPARMKLNLVAVESEKCHALADGWRTNDIPSEFHWLRRQAINALYEVKFQREELLGAPAELGCIDLRVHNPDYFCWTTELRIKRDGVMHGLGGWCDCELAEGVWMTNSPLSERAIQRPQMFLPIDEAIKVKSGDVLNVTVKTRPEDHVTAWTVQVAANGQKFSQSTWQGELLTPEDIVKRNPEHVPQPSREGQARMVVLGYCDGRRTARQIEEAVLREHPDLFPSAAEISRFVAHVLGKDAA